MEQAVKEFNRRFKPWGIFLPTEAVSNRATGTVRKRQWFIQYGFYRDEKGEHLDYYATHPEHGDVHVRLYANGDAARLEAMTNYWHKDGDDPENDKQHAAEYFEVNNRVARELKAKGFDEVDVDTLLHPELGPNRKRPLFWNNWEIETECQFVFDDKGRLIPTAGM